MSRRSAAAPAHVGADLARRVVPAGGGAWAILVRHAHRRPIRSPADGPTAGLTRRGRVEARAFGRELAPARLSRVIASPIQRCVDTAAAVIAGHGGASIAIETDELLAMAYVSEVDAWRASFYGRGPQAAMAAYLAGELVPGFSPIGPASEELMARVLAGMEEGAVTLYVTHDYVVIPFRHHFAGERFTFEHWFPFLGGAVIRREGGVVSVNGVALRRGPAGVTPA